MDLSMGNWKKIKIDKLSWSQPRIIRPSYPSHDQWGSGSKTPKINSISNQYFILLKSPTGYFFYCTACKGVLIYKGKKCLKVLINVKDSCKSSVRKYFELNRFCAFTPLLDLLIETTILVLLVDQFERDSLWRPCGLMDSYWRWIKMSFHHDMPSHSFL